MSVFRAIWIWCARRMMRLPIDFLKDPIIPRIDGDYLKASGTSLGGDDGIGVAACFAILEDKELKHVLWRF